LSITIFLIFCLGGIIIKYRLIYLIVSEKKNYVLV
jgi:hypothetical protein